MGGGRMRGAAYYRFAPLGGFGSAQKPHFQRFVRQAIRAAAKPRPARRARRMQSPAAVALTPRPWRRPGVWTCRRRTAPARRATAHGHSVQANAPLPVQKEPTPCRFADHPTAPVTPVQQALVGDRPELGGRATNRNASSQSIGIQPVALTRCAQPLTTSKIMLRCDELAVWAMNCLITTANTTNRKTASRRPPKSDHMFDQMAVPAARLQCMEPQSNFAARIQR